MCEYCENNKTLLEKDVVSTAMLQWCMPIRSANDLYAHEYPLGVFIDRGYLRLVDLEDCQCMDHGGKIKIKFCPFCGEGL